MSPEAMLLAIRLRYFPFETTALARANTGKRRQTPADTGKHRQEA